MQEQKAIANILSDMNDGIEAIEAKKGINILQSVKA